MKFIRIESDDENDVFINVSEISYIRVTPKSLWVYLINGVTIEAKISNKDRLTRYLDNLTKSTLS